MTTQKSSIEVATCRCSCGSLLARLVPGGVEIKCRRCRQLTVVPLMSGDEEGEVQGSLQSAGRQLATEADGSD